MIQCDNCLKKTQTTKTIKWPGLDTSMQYQEFCNDCNDLFYKWRQSGDHTILKQLLKRGESQNDTRILFNKQRDSR